MWKEEEAGNYPVNAVRTREATKTGANVVLAACPLCLMMLSHEHSRRTEGPIVRGIVELVADGLAGRGA